MNTNYLMGLSRFLIILPFLKYTSAQAENIVNYGDDLYLQVGWKSFLYLQGGRTEGNDETRVGNYNEDKRSNYWWQIRNTNRGTSGGCVKYDDIITFKNLLDNGAVRYLNSTGRKRGRRILKNEGNVYTDLPTSSDTFKWKIRSKLEEGSRSNPDPGEGECVRFDSIVYFQLMHADDLWLTGGRSDGNDECHARTFKSSNENDGNFKWILRKKSKGTGDGKIDDALQCQPKEGDQYRSGHWKRVQCSQAGDRQEVEFRYGITVTESQTTSWSHSIKQSIQFVIIGITSTTEYQLTMTESVTKSIAETNDVSHKQGFPSGCVWQFEYDVETICEVASLKTKDFAVTSSIDKEPCCLPGLFLNPDERDSGCKRDACVFCSPDKCHQDSSRIVDGGFDFCTPSNPCGRCQGDCDEDTDCIGNLVCYQREQESDPGPPRCDGAPVLNNDYCGDPMDNNDLTPPNLIIPAPTKRPSHVAPTLNLFYGGKDHCTPTNPCGRCEGDCDEDTDCMGNLVCHHRFNDADPPPPGCSGTTWDDADSCVDPPTPIKIITPAPTKRPSHVAPTLNLFYGGKDHCTPTNPCGRCEGDCDEDTDCMGNLVCHQRFHDADPPPPGCSGTTWDDADSCVDPNLFFGGSDYCTPSDPCGKCQGDCDEDADCMGNLVCFHRDAGDAGPPGCGGIPDTRNDYCFDPTCGDLKLNSNGPWQKCLNKDKDCCADNLKSVRPDLNIHFVPQGSMVTADHRSDRVRIWYNIDSNLVVKAPRVG